MQELWNVTKNSEEPVAVLYYNHTREIQWWHDIDVPIQKHTFGTESTMNMLEMKSQIIQMLPTIKLYHFRSVNAFEPEKIEQVEPWIKLHLEEVAMLDDSNFHTYGNGNAATLVAFDSKTCDELKKESNRRKHVRYACYTSGESPLENCKLGLFGKYSDAACVDSGVESINATLKSHVFPKLLNSQMMNDPLLYDLRPYNQSVYVISDTPPLVTNISSDVHVIWERTGSQMLPVSKPTVIRQHWFRWYGFEITSEEQALNAVHDVLAQTTPLNTTRFMAALQSRNFSLYFDDEWEGLRELFPKRRKIKKFNFSSIQIPEVPAVNFDLESDKKLAASLGIKVPEEEAPKEEASKEEAPKEDVPALQSWSTDDFNKHVRKGKPSLVKFFAPWCGHCRRFAGPYEEVAEALKEDDLHVAKIDITKNKGVYPVRSIPTIVYFPGVENSEEVKFELKRDKDTLVKWAKEQKDISIEVKVDL